MARSTYYFEINKTDPVAIRNEELLLVIKKIFVENKGRYGVRRVYMELKNRGYNVNHKRVQRLMHDAGLFGKRPKEKYHSYKGEVGKVADNVINRNFSTTLPLQKWTTDVSQFNFSWGKCYLSPILDMNTNEIISYDLALSPNLEQIKRMLDKAFDKYSSVNGLILHSDQGWQYQHAYYRNRLKEHGIIQSMSRKGNCYDNCIMETFFGRIKTELYYGFEKDYTSFEEFGKRPKEKYHSYKGEVGKVADNVINRNFSTTLPLQKWTTDVSQFNFSWGKCYLSPILDMNTNEIISYDLALSPNLEQIKRMLDKAFDKYSSVNGLILHSDQGWQYQHAYYRNRLKEHGIIQSMSRKGNCYDNCIMETFFGRIKTELYYGFEKDYTSFEEFAIAIDEYIDYYNSKRIQAKTKWMPPVKYREASMMSA